jgi:acetyl esterase
MKPWRAKTETVADNAYRSRVRIVEIADAPSTDQMSQLGCQRCLSGRDRVTKHRARSPEISQWLTVSRLDTEESIMTKPTLEPAAQNIAEATSKPPFLYELGPEGARKVLDDIQAAPIEKLAVDDRWVTVPAEVGDVQVRIVKPVGATGILPTILYMHGGGWILGNAGTHDRLVREFAVGVGAAVVFVEYDRSPEVHYPVAIEQGYATARWIMSNGATEGLDASRLAVAGDSVGGNMTAALAILAKQRGDVTFVHQSMYYPVTDAAQNTDSYREFADGPFLTAKGMAWFWDAYLPHWERRGEITASPLRASLDELAGLPEAFLIVDENDVLRDEGEAYARKLTQAGVRTTSVRYNGIIHDFMMLNPVRETAATSGAIEQAVHILRKALGTH